MKSIVLSLIMRYLPEILEMVFDYLKEIAKKSPQKWDDQIVEILEKLANGLLEEKQKPQSDRIKYRRR